MSSETDLAILKIKKNQPVLSACFCTRLSALAALAGILQDKRQWKRQNPC